MVELRESDLLGTGAICPGNQAFRHDRKEEETNSLEIRDMESCQCLEAEFVVVSNETATSLKTKRIASGIDIEIGDVLLFETIGQEFASAVPDSLPMEFTPTPMGGNAFDPIEKPISTSFCKQLLTIKAAFSSFLGWDQLFRYYFRSVAEDQNTSRKKPSSANLGFADSETENLSVREPNTSYLLSELFIYKVLFWECFAFSFSPKHIKNVGFPKGLSMIKSKESVF